MTDKRTHVSPFTGMKLQYGWILTPPGEKLVAHRNVGEEGKAFFAATRELQRRERRTLPRVLADIP